MFTGVVETMGTIRATHAVGSGVRLLVEAPGIAREIRPSDSIAVDGCCLTIERVEGEGFYAFASHETLQRTTLRSLRVGSRVNLERALALGDRLAGHLVIGHVDGVGEIASIHSHGTSWVMNVRVAHELHNFLVQKGSIAVDGISLTVVDVLPDGFSVVIIPFSFKSTTLQWKKSGDRVNLEFDLMAKYVQRFVAMHLGERGAVTFELLARTGFIK